MKTEEAIERLQAQIEYKEEWMEFWKEKGATDYRLRDTELDLEMLRMAVWALKDGMRWIPCSERLPREEDKVLCCTQTKAGAKNIVLGYYADGKWRCGMNSNVVAWRPLPQTYKED